MDWNGLGLVYEQKCKAEVKNIWGMFKQKDK